ncbi:hypothetical protein BIW11_06718 [Tropilaelaps mercedesae]|uniref:Uncharacterized protein n=1 Tax=Tropilaelaps mercedesae TaxID=418985 RepID=A0A1V9XWZ9_9ACAR|nr:hypothetical protein BIW11_06718 [Tropilaelaps mercedesae]
MEKLRKCIENLDREEIDNMIKRHIREKSGRNLPGIYKAIRRGKQILSITVESNFRQSVTKYLRRISEHFLIAQHYLPSGYVCLALKETRVCL